MLANSTWDLYSGFKGLIGKPTKLKDLITKLFAIFILHFGVPL